jgi:RHS repeat-associated protein
MTLPMHASPKLRTPGRAVPVRSRLRRIARPTSRRGARVTVRSRVAGTAEVVASSVAYMPFGPAQSLTLGNGVQVANSFDFDYRLTGTQASLGSATLQSLSLTYDPASNVETIADAVTPGLSQSFQYNLGGHVTRGTGVYGTDNYTYDAMGNRLTRSLVKGTTASTTYTYTTTSTRLASAATGSTTLSYTYDAMGSVTARKLGNTTQAAYTYNADGRLATAAGATMKYNAFGQRSVQTVTGGGNHFLFGPGGLLLAEHGTTGAAQRNYVYLNGQPLAVVDAAGAISYVLNDHLGQPQKMLNAAGAVTWHRVAGVYGDTASQPVGTTAANPNRFPGQQQDAVTGLYYNYFRDYDPATGRYLEADPIGLAAGTNLYAYVGGNPVNRGDPLGLAPSYPTPPDSIPGGPWEPAGPGQRPGTFYGPRQPSGPRPQCNYVPPESQGGMPGAKQPYYETFGPNGKQRYSMAGEPITPKQAHGQNQRPSPLPPSRPWKWLNPLYIACYAVGICNPSPAN